MVCLRDKLFSSIALAVGYLWSARGQLSEDCSLDFVCVAYIFCCSRVPRGQASHHSFDLVPYCLVHTGGVPVSAPAPASSQE